MSHASLEAKKAILKHTFPEMDDVTLTQLATLARVATYDPHYALCHEGRHEDTFYIMIEGEVVFTKIMGNEDHILRSGHPGEFFGEMALLDASSGRSATVRTTTRTTVIELDRTIFNALIEKNPALIISMSKIIIRRMRENDRLALAELKAQKQEIQRAYDSLKKLDEQRNIFLTTLAHELRTPLTGVMGYMQLLRGGLMKGPALQMSLEKIGGGLDRMVSLINDLLFIQQIEVVEPHFKKVNLKPMLEDVVLKYRPVAEQQKTNIKLTVAAELPDMMADPDGLSRAFGHLVDNAIKFSPEGGDIHVEAQDDGQVVEVRVSDHGVGIAEEFMPRLFKRFERDETYKQHLFGGVGLGMPIVKHIVDNHNGLIEILSKRGEGTTFVLRFPIDAKRATVELNVDDAWVDVPG